MILTRPTLILTAALALSLVLIPQKTAAARATADPTVPPVEITPAAAGEAGFSPEDSQGDRRKRLEQLYARLVEQLPRQEARLKRADEINQRVEMLVERLRQQGLDPAPVIQALEAFNQGITEARAEHLKAKAVLAIHAGFNDNGKVTHIDEAIETVRTAGTSLRRAARTAGEAFTELVKALREYRQLQRPAQL